MYVDNLNSLMIFLKLAFVCTYVFLDNRFDTLKPIKHTFTLVTLKSQLFWDTPDFAHHLNSNEKQMKNSESEMG